MSDSLICVFIYLQALIVDAIAITNVIIVPLHYKRYMLYCVYIISIIYTRILVDGVYFILCLLSLLLWIWLTVMWTVNTTLRTFNLHGMIVFICVPVICTTCIWIVRSKRKFRILRRFYFKNDIITVRFSTCNTIRMNKFICQP